MKTDKRVKQAGNYRERHKRAMAIKRAEKRAKRVIRPKAEGPYANRPSPRSGVVPPKKSRWKPGQSGNPKGRPKKMDSMTSLLRAEIAKLHKSKEGRKTWMELIVLATLKLALKGNKTASAQVWDRMEGKVTMPVGLTGGERPIKIKIVYGDEGEDSSE